MARILFLQKTLDHQLLNTVKGKRGLFDSLLEASIGQKVPSYDISSKLYNHENLEILRGIFPRSSN
jgi:hypothetical protein